VLGHPVLGDGRQERVDLDAAPSMAPTAAIISRLWIWSADQEKSIRIPRRFRTVARGKANAMTGQTKRSENQPVYAPSALGDFENRDDPGSATTSGVLSDGSSIAGASLRTLYWT